jgi:hypothetical protein
MTPRTVGSINYSISGFPNWLTPSSTSGSASTGRTVTFTVNTTANSLAVGTYGPTTITFANSGTGQGTQTRTATLIVNPPALQVTPATSIAASGTQGGPFSPTSFRYELSATYGSVKYSITTPSWLTASPKSGTVTKSARTITFDVNSSAHSLRPNTYVDSVNFNNTSNGPGSTTRLATLTVNPKQFKITVEASPKADGTVSGGGGSGRLRRRAELQHQRRSEQHRRRRRRHPSCAPLLAQLVKIGQKLQIFLASVLVMKNGLQ